MARKKLLPLGIILTFIFLLFIIASVSAELINDGSFENNPSDWDEFFGTVCNPSGIGDWSDIDGAPANYEGNQTLWTGGVCQLGPNLFIERNNGAVQEIQFADDAVLLSFWYHPIKNFEDPQNGDQAVVALNDIPVWTLNVDGITSPTEWTNALVDVSEFAGQTNALSLELQHDNDSDIANVFFDFVEILHPSLQISQITIPETVAESDNFIVEITIENSGDTVLDNISVLNTSFTDCDRDAGSLSQLNQGENITYSCSVSNATLNMENTAVAQATTTSIAYPVEAENTISSFVVDPLIELTVNPNPVSVTESEQISFAVTVTNSGSGELTNVQISSAEATSCILFLGRLEAEETAVLNCTYAPSISETIIFVASAIEPRTNSETKTETAVSIEVLPVQPPTVPIHNIYLPMTANIWLNQNALGEPNNECNHAYTITPNQSQQFLAEDTNDWYTFTVNNSGNINISLTNFVPIAGQITLWRGDCQSLTLVGQNGDFSTQKSINLNNQPPTTYYLWLINDGPTNSSEKYTLLVSAP